MVDMKTNFALEEKFRATGGKRHYVQRLFGRIARVYDLMNFLMSFGLDRYWRKRAARYLALATGETGLDLGTGTADLSITVLKNSGPSGICAAPWNYKPWKPGRSLTEMRSKTYRWMRQTGLRK